MAASVARSGRVESGGLPGIVPGAVKDDASKGMRRLSVPLLEERAVCAPGWAKVRKWGKVSNVGGWVFALEVGVPHVGVGEVCECRRKLLEVLRVIGNTIEVVAVRGEPAVGEYRVPSVVEQGGDGGGGWSAHFGPCVFVVSGD